MSPHLVMNRYSLLPSRSKGPVGYLSSNGNAYTLRFCVPKTEEILTGSSEVGTVGTKRGGVKAGNSAGAVAGVSCASSVAGISWVSAAKACRQRMLLSKSKVLM